MSSSRQIQLILPSSPGSIFHILSICPAISTYGRPSLYSAILLPLVLIGQGKI